MYRLSGIQKITVWICTTLTVIGTAFGILTKSSFLHLSEQPAAYDNAVLDFSEDAMMEIDAIADFASLEQAKDSLDKYPYAFIVRCTDTQHCYQCTKFTAEVLKTIKGDVDETGRTITLYQWVFFEKRDKNRLVFSTPEFSLPLAEGKEYLVFAIGREYYEGYRKTLAYNEYSMGCSSYAPCAYIINDTQKDYIRLNENSTYSEISDKYYLCFSENALKKVNKLSKEVINYYCNKK